MFQFKITSTKSKSDTSICSENSTDSSVTLDSNANQYSVGDRVKCDDYFGTIRYVGPVDPHPGVWLGVEWDDPSRGRHDGTVNGVTYFKTEPNAASFVRPAKVKKVRNIFEAIHERYGFDPDAISDLTDIDGGLERRKIDYSHLKIVDVSSRQISDLGKPGELAALAPNIERLYIADNLFTEWEAIGDLCKGLNRLKLLDISENALQPVPEKLNDTLETVFQSLEHVIMGKINYDWTGVITSSYMWKNLGNLQVPYNKISRIVQPQVTLLNLTCLDLGGNHISSWDEILKLEVLKKLEYLNLFGNRITNIHFPNDVSREDNTKTSMFPNLARLNLSENCVADWVSINELNKLPELKELRIDTNPFLDNDTRANNRQYIIARIGKLQKLDGVEITRQERRDSELDYIKKFASLWASKEDSAKFSVEHPRYPELVKLFGQSEAGESENNALKTCLLNLQIIPEDQSQRPLEKKLLATMTVQKLKMLLQRLFKLHNKRIEINVVSGRNSCIKFPLDNDFYDLSQYSLEDGDQLLLKW